MAIACLRLVTFLPERPLRNVPRLRSFMARSTFAPAALPYLAMPVSITRKQLALSPGSLPAPVRAPAEGS
jgi:hypothetical protein